MTTKVKRIVKIIVVLALVGIVVGGGTAYYLFNMPHRNVQETKADFAIESSDLVAEYLENYDGANDKYLSEDGESKVLSVTGIVSSIDTNMNGQKVIVLKSETDKAGVNCSFTNDTNASVDGIEVGEVITIKGVIRSGANYDEDLELYENIIIEKSTLVSK